LSDLDRPEPEIRALAPTEREVISVLLSEDFPGRDELVGQLDHVSGRIIDDDGSLELRVTADAPRAPVTARVATEGHMADSDGMMVHVLLHVVDGFMSELEIYRDDSTPPRRRLDPNAIHLGYAEPPEPGQ
jgi:hypothetical protein